MELVHLHTHSNYSFLEGACTIEELCMAAKRMGMKALALTDTNGFYGLIDFLKLAREFDIIPLIGAEIVAGSEQAVLLAKSRKGYSSICRIISARHIKKDFSLGGWLTKDREDIVILTSSLPLIDKLSKVVTHDLYVDLSGTSKTKLFHLARRYRLPVVATNDVHFVSADGYDLHRILRSIALRTTPQRLAEEECASPNAWFASPKEMVREFSFCPQAVKNTIAIAETCAFEFTLGEIILPGFPLPKGVKDSLRHLRDLCYKGAMARYGKLSSEVISRLEYELSIVRRRGYVDYFLVVNDIVRHHPLNCGRGSGAASLISYSLGITHVDPVRYNLSFERFLNEGRVDPPDIDVDFAWDERDKVLEYVLTTYGKQRTAMVANHVSFKPRGAMREVARVHGVPEDEIKRITAKIGWGWGGSNTLGGMAATNPKFQGMSLGRPWDEILPLAQKIIGYPRHLSVHPGGIVIVPDRISNYVPVQNAPGKKGIRIIQWEKDGTEDFGLVKIDLLGNRSLAVIRDSLKAIRKNYDVTLDYKKWNPLDDERTKRLIQGGETIGIFYVESPAMRLLQKKTDVGDFEHLVINSSLIRPAANAYIRRYVSRLRGEPFEPGHPLLEEALKETYGIMVYQEDVSRVAMALANFSMVEADGLRKVLSRKSKKELWEYREIFYSKARENRIPKSVIDNSWDMTMSFSGYSFCKPHSASYALVSFKSAYLKTYYPAEFMAAVISNQGGFYSTFAYISEARRMGISITSPDVNESEREYTGYHNTMRVGFMQLRGFKDESMGAILDARKDGRFHSIEDFLGRVEIDPTEVKSLIKAGAFDSIAQGSTRPELMWRRLRWEESRRKAKETISFDEELPEVGGHGDYNEITKLRHEFETLGILISRHPLTLYRSVLRKVSYVNAVDLPKYVGETVVTLGWYVTSKTVLTRKAELMNFVSFEDTTGIYEATMFPKAYMRFCNLLNKSHPFLLKGKVEEEFGAITFTIHDLKRLG